MKIGIKRYYYAPELEYFDGRADFIEIMAVEGKDYSKLKDFKIPIVVHAQHQNFGINNADKNLFEKNKSSLNFAIKVADALNAKKIIVHPGMFMNDGCSPENAADFFRLFRDKRIFVENMPMRDSLKQLCISFEDTADFLEKTQKNFCLDINHAVMGSLILNEDYISRLRDYLKLKPKHFHIGGQKLNGDSHLNFRNSEIDIKKILSLLPDDAELTIETSNDFEGTKEDLEFLQNMLKYKK